VLFYINACLTFILARITTYTQSHKENTHGKRTATKKQGSKETQEAVSTSLLDLALAEVTVKQDNILARRSIP
jgi:hypothetical protein